MGQSLDLAGDRVADRRRSREPEAAEGMARDERLSAREAGLLQLQRTAGNHAVAAMLARSGESRPLSRALVQREYKPQRNQQKELERWVKVRWDKEDADDIADITGQIAKWCSSHAQAAQLSELKYEDFEELRSRFATADEAITQHGTFAAALGGQSATKPQTQAAGKQGKATDPHAETKRRIKQAGYEVSKFSEDDLSLIETSKSQPSVGWDSAIMQVWTAKSEKENSARLASERTAKYAPAKAAGDILFTDALAKRVWSAAHALAISGSSASGNPNITLSGPALTRDEVLTAIADWRAHPTVANNLVDQLHVPGGQQPIQDKANREINPDPERRFQADFCSYWSNTKVNVHVDVLTRTMTGV
jgi:hypothetical protein